MVVFHSVPAFCCLAAAACLAWKSRRSASWLPSALCMLLFACLTLLTLCEGGSLLEALAYLLSFLCLMLAEERSRL